MGNHVALRGNTIAMSETLDVNIKPERNIYISHR